MRERPRVLEVRSRTGAQQAIYAGRLSGSNIDTLQLIQLLKVLADLVRADLLFGHLGEIPLQFLLPGLRQVPVRHSEQDIVLFLDVLS